MKRLRASRRATPNHDELGRFASAEGTSHAFVSPNLAHALSLTQASDALHGERQKLFMHAAHEINDRLGLTGTETPVLGAWADGAENSAMMETDGSHYEALKLATVMKGDLANQRAVLIFKDHPDGNAALYRMTVQGNPVDLHASLLNHGVAFHTLIPHGGTTEVVVADLDGSLTDHVEAFAGEHDVIATQIKGTGEFIGGDESLPDAECRADARKAYERVIDQAPAYRGTAAREIWQGVRDHWGARLQALKRAITKAMTFDQIFSV